MYEFAVKLIRKGKAYVCDLSEDEVREYRGTLTEPGRDSPYRDRSIEENLDLFQRMRAGEFPDGARTLRAKIDMASPNINMRDPVMYRIRHATHHRTGDTWCIYPMYDFAHGQSDSIEGVTHSLCDLELRGPPSAVRLVPGRTGNLPSAADRVRPPQHDLHDAQQAQAHPAGDEGPGSRLGRSPHADAGADCGGAVCPPEAIRDFCDRIGVAKANSIIDIALLENSHPRGAESDAPRG